MSTTTIYSTNPTPLAPFYPQSASCVIFCEADERVLRNKVSNDSPAGQWGLPGGKLLEKEELVCAVQRIFKEQMNFTVAEKDVMVKALISDKNSNLYICKVDYGIAPQELQSCEWISIFAFGLLSKDPNEQVAADRQKAFDVLYENRMWRRVIAPSKNEVNNLVLKKGEKRLVFDRDQRFVVPLIGTSDELNQSLAESLQSIFGLPNISHVDVFDKEPADSDLAKMFEAFSEKRENPPIPDELSAGMLAKRLSSQDCLAGYTLRLFPVNATQYRIFFDLFVRSTDFVLPVQLKTANDSTEDEVSTAFQNQTLVEQVIQIDPSKQNEILHKVLQVVEQRLNALAKKSKSPPRDKLDTVHTTTSTQNGGKWGNGGILVFSTVAAVVGLAAGLHLGVKVK